MKRDQELKELRALFPEHFDMDVYPNQCTGNFVVVHFNLTAGAVRKMAKTIVMVAGEAFPFRRGDLIQHVSGTGPVMIVRGVDDEAYEAWAEVSHEHTSEEDRENAESTRIINPGNWKKFDKRP